VSEADVKHLHVIAVPAGTRPRGVWGRDMTDEELRDLKERTRSAYEAWQLAYDYWRSLDEAVIAELAARIARVSGEET
jgi:hypothetical protein